eukprot:snap_masked-scaffold_50-processed-gene-0.28-mRNA-1 protein AED:1.00 eAED:1.00 QI:0/0/0/0/1/1/2/0/66
MSSHRNLDISLFDISLCGVSSSLLSSIFKLNDEILKGVCLNEEKKSRVMLLRNQDIEDFYEKPTDA